MQNNALKAILAVFPTAGEFETFQTCDGSTRIIESLTDFAFRLGVIKANNNELLYEVIKIHAEQGPNVSPPKVMTMEMLLDNKEDHWKTDLSGRGLVARINALLVKHDIALPKISNTMLTRIKKEPADTLHKQNVLRSLAFWLGYERNDLDVAWNYVTLLEICPMIERQISAREGVRVGFSLISRGDLIEQEIIDWLRKGIKQFIKENIATEPYGQWGSVRIYDITTLYVDFPKAEGNGLSCYQQSTRNALSVAHQMAIRWALSPFATQKRFIVTAIAAGKLTTLDNYLQPILNAKLPGDPAIRVSDFARQCILVNDIRAVFNDQPREVGLFNGEHLSIWWIVGLWSLIYWPFIPDLLQDETILDPIRLKKYLAIQYPGHPKTESHSHDNAINALLRTPQNALLGIEITKTLYYKNNLWGALEILRIILSTNPTNVNARSLRLVIFRNLGSNARSYSVALTQFKRAEKEAEYILANCHSLDEDFYDEYGVLKLAHAISILRCLRKHRGQFSENGINVSQSMVCTLLNEAEHLLEIAMCVSPIGTRSLYLLTCLRMLKHILSYDADIYVNPEKPVAMPVYLANKPALDMFYALGYIDEARSAAEQVAEIDSALEKQFQHHSNALALDVYRPTLYFCYAAVLWDFYPVRTMETARNTIKLLEGAIEMARKYQNDPLYIYSYNCFYGEMIHPSVFIAQLSELLSKIKVFIADLDGSQPFTPAEKAQSERFLLFSHFIGRTSHLPVGPGE